MKTRANLLAAGILLAALLNSLAQPVISTQPQDQTNYVGTTACFTVVATGTGPVSYQWQKFSTGFADLADRTNTVLILTNVQTSDAADYRVIVTDAIGTNISATARLSVALPETLFISQPSPGLVTLSWQGSMVLLQTGLQTGPWSGYFNVPAWVRSLDCPVWVRVADTSPVTLPIGPDTQFFRLVALPFLAAYGTNINMENCRAGDVKACEGIVANYLLSEPIGTLSPNSEMELAASRGTSLGSCVSAAQLQVMVLLRRRATGP